MSNTESKKNILRYICVALAIVVVLFLASPHHRKKEDDAPIAEDAEKPLPLSDFYINYSNGNEVSFSATLTKEEFVAFLNEKGASAPQILHFIPKEVSLSCTAKVKSAPDGEGVRLTVLNANVNGIEIPQKLLSDIGEIDLDFKRSLVYN